MLKQVQHDRSDLRCHSELVSESQCNIIYYVCISSEFVVFCFTSELPTPNSKLLFLFFGDLCSNSYISKNL